MSEAEDQGGATEVKEPTADAATAAAEGAPPAEPTAGVTPPAADTGTVMEPEINADPLTQSAVQNQADPNASPLLDPSKIDLLNELYVSITIEIGRAQIKIRDLLSLTKGSIIELNKLAGEPVDVYANGKLIASGNIITANGKYCVRLASINEKSKIGINNNGN